MITIVLKNDKGDVFIKDIDTVSYYIKEDNYIGVEGIAWTDINEITSIKVIKNGITIDCKDIGE